MSALARLNEDPKRNIVRHLRCAETIIRRECMTAPETPQGDPSLVLPSPRLTTSKFIANVLHDDILYVSGQLPYHNDQIEVTGIVGIDVSVSLAEEAARLCALNALATISAELGGLQRVRQILRVTGYVACPADFASHAKVVDAASAVLLQALGDRGKHARSAIGVSSLPRNSPVEIELTVAVVGAKV